MAVLINGMEMPQTCFKCKLSRITPSMYAFCSLNGKCYPADETPPSDCPLVPVPPHGRLIDADAFTKNECNNCDGDCEVLPCDCLNCEADCRCDFMKDIAEAPTIIEAEEGET